VEVDDFVAGFGTLGRGPAGPLAFPAPAVPHAHGGAGDPHRPLPERDHLAHFEIGELPVEITSVIGNRETCRSIAERAGLPFHLVEMDGDRKEEGFRRIHGLLEEEGVELAVLARFMQIVPDWLCEKFAGRMINIHHSFLPAFIGANPYRQAYERGVKLIGATCHYVTADLDAGPIIEQEVERVQHFHTPQDLVRLGRHCERIALARGIRYHVHDRTIIDGHRAIVFPD
jgi:formyltetrahydrofolate deformylase